jgi:hypothetical protein
LIPSVYTLHDISPARNLRILESRTKEFPNYTSISELKGAESKKLEVVHEA